MADFRWNPRYNTDKKLNKFVSRMPGVQDAVQVEAEGIADRADRALASAKQRAQAKGDSGMKRARITIEKAAGTEYSGAADVDRLVNLDDPGGAAGSIEYGRAGYRDPETGEEWGAMEPLYILTNAARTGRSRKQFNKRIRKRRKNG